MIREILVQSLKVSRESRCGSLTIYMIIALWVTVMKLWGWKRGSIRGTFSCLVIVERPRWSIGRYLFPEIVVYLYVTDWRMFSDVTNMFTIIYYQCYHTNHSYWWWWRCFHSVDISFTIIALVHVLFLRLYNRPCWRAHGVGGAWAGVDDPGTTPSLRLSLSLAREQ